MAHWAEIDDNGVVLRVTVGNDADPGEGYDWLVENLGGTWVKTSYNTLGGVHLLGGTPLRKNYAGVGFSYDETRDAFIPPKPFESWVLDEGTCLWEAPVPMPDGDWVWDEQAGAWKEVTNV